MTYNTIFTGLIKHNSEVLTIQSSNGMVVTLSRPNEWNDLEMGESILINGVCSTAQNIQEESFNIVYMPETLKVTTLSDLKIGQCMNVERSLTPRDLMGGHVLYGHVDAIAIVKKIKKEGNATVMGFELDKEWMKFFVSKGPIAIDGISLTLVDVGSDSFSVSLIRHTLEHTNLHSLKIGDAVNIEVDMNAKYLYKFIQDKEKN